MMPAALLRFLPHILIVAVVLGGVAWIDHRGYQRAKADADQRALVAAAIAERKARRLEAALADIVGTLDAQLAERIAAIDVTERTIIQPTIEREIARETRLSDPALGLTDGLRKAINAAIAQTHCTTQIDGSAVCALPAMAAAPDQRDR